MSRLHDQACRHAFTNWRQPVSLGICWYSSVIISMTSRDPGRRLSLPCVRVRPNTGCGPDARRREGRRMSYRDAVLYGMLRGTFELENICPLEQVQAEPFIARCCRSEREGICKWNKKFGTVVHWGASPSQISSSINDLVEQWRRQ